jgi:triacylglycerol lipase
MTLAGKFQKYARLIFKEYKLILKRQFESFSQKDPPTEWSNGNKGNIILIPGFFETWVFFKNIADNLNKQGYRILVVKKLGRNLKKLEEASGDIIEFLENNKIQEAFFLTHSKGGIVGKFLLEHPKAKPVVKKLITIAAPYGGTLLGKFKFFNLNQLMPSSKEIKNILNSNINYPNIYNIYPTVDNHVLPNKNLILNGAKNIKVNVVGHTRILEAKKTVKTILKILTA